MLKAWDLIAYGRAFYTGHSLLDVEGMHKDMVERRRAGRAIFVSVKTAQ